MRSNPATFTESARRRQIVDCAIDTIAELGYHQASVRKIADRLGLAMSNVLYHFGSKDDLVAAIVSDLYRSVIAGMLPSVRAETSASGRLAAHIRAHIGYIADRPSHQVALMEIGSNYRSRSGGRIADISIDLEPDELAELAELQLETIIREGVESGEFRSLSTASTAMAVRSAIGGAVMAVTADPGFDVRAYGEDLVDLFLRASRGEF